MLQSIERSEQLRERKTLTRACLQAAICGRLPGLSRADAATYIDAILDEVSDALCRGESVGLHGFGKFLIRGKNARQGRNPRTGKPAVIGARKVVSFKPSALLVNRINER